MLACVFIAAGRSAWFGHGYRFPVSEAWVRILLLALPWAYAAYRLAVHALAPARPVGDFIDVRWERVALAVLLFLGYLVGLGAIRDRAVRAMLMIAAVFGLPAMCT